MSQPNLKMFQIGHLAENTKLNTKLLASTWLRPKIKYEIIGFIATEAGIKYEISVFIQVEAGSTRGKPFLP